MRNQRKLSSLSALKLFFSSSIFTSKTSLFSCLEKLLHSWAVLRKRVLSCNYTNSTRHLCQKKKETKAPLDLALIVALHKLILLHGERTFRPLSPWRSPLRSRNRFLDQVPANWTTLYLTLPYLLVGIPEVSLESSSSNNRSTALHRRVQTKETNSFQQQILSPEKGRYEEALKGSKILLTGRAKNFGPLILLSGLQVSLTNFGSNDIKERLLLSPVLSSLSNY